jgi:glyoxylate reductase
MKANVFVTRRLPEPAMEALRAQCEVAFFDKDEPMKPAALMEACQAADGLLVVANRITEDLIFQSRRLKVISTPSVGYDNIDVAACTRRGIAVTNTAGVLEETTADLAFALLLAVARRIAEADQYVREGRWKLWQFNLLHGSNVYGKTLGLIGFGHIGQAMARRARGFAMRVLYWTRSGRKESAETETGALYADRDQLLAESDFVSLHVPLVAETRHFVQKRHFALMKTAAFLINTARGPVVDEEALVEALKTKRIAGAGLDVFEHEPAVHPELLKLTNVVLAPHIGSATTETRTAMALLAAQNLLEALAGRRPPNILNPEVYR